MKEVVEKILEKYSHAGRDSLIPMLQEVQDEVGYLSDATIEMISAHLGIASSKVFGLATFYNQFRFQAKGKCHIQVCHGTACHLLGVTTIIEQLEKQLSVKVGQTTRNGDFSLEVVSCMGACAHAPVLQVNGVFKSHLTETSLKELIDELIETFRTVKN